MSSLSGIIEQPRAAGHGTAPKGAGLHAWLAPVPAVVLATVFAACLPIVAAGETLRFAIAWVPSLGINLSFLVDGLSLTFALLVTGVGGLVTVYCSAYLSGHTHYGRLYLYLLLFMGSMLGLVLADNLITLFVFWELTTIVSFLLIGFDHSSPKARRSALQALLLTGAGGLALLAGLILLGSVAGSFELTEIKPIADTVRGHGLYLPILILILIGAFTKSAQIPFHFWLPNAMAAPTPVSAYLHSATMVKAGVYLLARMHPVLAGTEAWIWTLTLFGAATAVLAAVLALRQTDLKLALAYTTVMALGTLTMFLGGQATVAVAAAVTFLIVHSFYKAALFLVVGNIDHRTGTRDVGKLSGLAGAMPFTAVAAAAAALSIAGFPPFLGFIGKELKYEGALAIASEPLLVAAATVIANALILAVAGVVALRPFRGQMRATMHVKGDVPVRMWLPPPLILAVLGLAFGIAPSLIEDTFIQPAVTAILGRPASVDLALWHGINLPLMLSMLTIVIGGGIYAFHPEIRSLLIRADARFPLHADRVWDHLINGLRWVAVVQTALLQNGILRRYLFVVFAACAGTLGAALYARGFDVPLWTAPDLTVAECAVVVLTIAGTVMTVLSRSRLAAVCALGVVGIGVALIFVLYGAPDVAITQLMVETLVVILVALVMLRLPRLTRDGTAPARRADAVVAVAVGSVVAAALLAVVSAPIDRSITDFFETASVPQAFGRNIVNVILVDFRALDTLGEIAVVAVAALAAYALIRRTKPGERS